MPGPRESHSYFKSLQRLRVKMKNRIIVEKRYGESDEGEPDKVPYVGSKDTWEDDELAVEGV